MKRYQYYQPNKKDIKDKRPDCSIRALCKFLDKEWIEVFDLLVPIAREEQSLLNAKPVLEIFMQNNGCPFISKHNSGKTVGDIAKTGITAICYCRVGYRTHLTAVRDGKYYDTWDSGSRIVYGYWEKP